MKGWLVFVFNVDWSWHEVKSCDKPRYEETQAFQYREWLKAGYRRVEEGQWNRKQDKPTEAETKAKTASTVTLEAVTEPTNVSGINISNLENHGLVMDISMDHAEKEKVNRNSNSLPNKKEVQISDKAEALVIKENTMNTSIMLHTKLIRDNSFNVPILDSTWNLNSKAVGNVTQANEFS